MIYVWFVFRNDDVWDPSADGHVGQSSTAARTRKWSQSGSDQSWSKGSTKQNYSMKNRAVLRARKKFLWIVCLFNFSNLFFRLVFSTFEWGSRFWRTNPKELSRTKSAKARRNRSNNSSSGSRQFPMLCNSNKN